MKHLSVLIGLMIASSLWATSLQAEEAKVYSMSGRIAAIDMDADTIVVEVPIKGNETMTIGGPVIDDARLQKDGRQVDLDEFEVGDWVKVTWQKTAETLLIQELAAG